MKPVTKIRHTASLIIMILTMCGTVLGDTSERDLGKQPVLDLNKVNEFIYRFTNDERRKNNLPPFIIDKTLEKAAMIQSDYMSKIGYMTHHGTTYPNPRDRVSAVCGEKKPDCLNRYRETPKGPGRYYNCCSENVIESFALTMNAVPFHVVTDSKGTYRIWKGEVKWLNEEGLAREMVQRWMDSPPHRMNILNSRLKAMGTAVSWDKNEKYYGTQVFAPLAD